MKKKITVFLILGILLAAGWFLGLSPIIKFRNNENLVLEAAKNYFDLNASELPTGNRIKTVTLKTLYRNKFLDKDVYDPYGTKTCSVDKSWVKVKRVNDEYQYYVNLDCGVFKSSIDAVGPEIELNGDKVVTINIGEEYKEMGVKSVIDKKDGELSIEDVSIKSNVDTSHLGTYEVSYIAFDTFSNKTEVKRTVKVVKKLYQTIKNVLGEATNFRGEPTNNYVRLSNMLYRVYGVDSNKNVILVADVDVSNVNYSKLDEWLEYYYKHLNKKTQKMIVPSKYCNMEVVDEASLATTECSSYTESRKVYIPSIVEVNKAQDLNGNFMKTYTMSWVSNKKNDKEAYLTRKVFYYEEYGKSFLPYDVIQNYGVRPMMVIKGSSLIQGGDGSFQDPYTFGDSSIGRGGSLVNERSTGEYIRISDRLFRIVDVMKDGTTKVISDTSIGRAIDDMSFMANSGSDKITYNPEDKNSVAYYIENRAVEYVDIDYFEKHEIEVPIYKKEIIYNEEVSTKKYNVILSAPNMYEMFSAKSIVDSEGISLSYWLLNTSKTKRIGAAIYDMGVPVNEEISEYDEYGIRVVGFLKKNTTITSGKGTYQQPYKLK